MRILALASAGAFALALTGAAYAAPAETTPAQNAPAAQSGQMNGDSMKSLNQTNLRQQLRDHLAKAGFTAINIMPSSFYVQAKNKKGEPVAMVIGPDSFTEVTEMRPNTQASNAPAPTHSPQPTTPAKK